MHKIKKKPTIPYAFKLRNRAEDKLQVEQKEDFKDLTEEQKMRLRAAGYSVK